MPNLNVKLTLVYAFKLKSIKSSITTVNRVQNGSGYSDKDVKPTSMFSSTGASESANDGIYASEKIGNVFMRVMSGNKNKMENRSDDEHTKNRMVKTYSTYYSFAYSSYNLYVINDAFNVMWMIEEMLTNENNISTANKLKLAKYYSYISTFNPNDYASKGEMNYLFDNAYKDKGTPLSDYQYSTFYKFMKEQLTIHGYRYPNNAKKYLSILPDPTKTSQFMKINRIDVASAARSAIQVNFIANQFKQTDLVVSVIELKEQYQEQRFVAGRVGALDAIADFGSSLWNWVTGKGWKSTIEERQDAYGHQAYRYYPAAKGLFSGVGGTPMLSFSDGHIANALSFNASEQTPMQLFTGITDNLDDPAFAPSVASIYQMSANRKGNYFATTTSSASLRTSEFYNYSTNSVSSISSNISIYTGEDTRLAIQFYDLDPEDYKTKHDRVTEIIAIAGAVLAGILAVAAHFTPIGWLADAFAIIAVVSVSVASASLVERVSSDVTKALNTEAMKDVLRKARAHIYSLAFIPKDGVFEFNRVREDLIDEQVKEAIKAG